MPSNLLHWYAAGAILIGAIVSIFRPDNTACPISLPASTRSLIALIGGAAQTALMSIGQDGTPVMTALITAALSVLTALAAHGFRGSPTSSGSTPAGARGFVRVGPLLQLSAIAFAVALAACSWWSSGGNTKVTNAVVCIETDALKGDTVLQIAEDCGEDVAQVLVSLVNSTDSRVRASSAGREAFAARRALGVGDGGS